LSARSRYALAAAVLLGVEVGIAVFVHDRIVRPYVGDALVVVLVYLVLRAGTRLRVGPAVGAAFAIACAVEVSQYFHLVDRLGLGRNAFARALLGTHFDPPDFLAYAVGAVATLLVERRRSPHA
jgi:hypothetical protein